MSNAALAIRFSDELLLARLNAWLNVSLTYRVAAVHAGPPVVEPPRALALDRFGLTARESEVLAFLAAHYTNREIADALVVSVRTVEHHVAHILRKLDVPNRRAAAALVRLSPAA